MANIPNDPYRPSDASRRSPYADDARDAAQLDNELQPDPELAEGPASGGRVAAYTIAVAVVLAAVFYGLDHSSIRQATTSPAAQNTAQNNTAQNKNGAPPAAPPGMRDVTPHGNNAQSPNAAPGVTTGSAVNSPKSPTPSASDSERSANPFNHGEQH